ncbi:hypothetical protein L6164_003319 [Bauhinia variegata]|uniref:Uncharacterized protein n=1 Tax=Bauhinia variegata TaxID=167791 RepID=A0ACB9Q2F8_BAUVA|nr:hypothetical protein L6164_003319 [Bauhinia variegata]
MATSVSQFYIVGILFLVLVFASGPAIGFYVPGYNCQWSCSSGPAACNSLCTGKGFKEGGECMGFSASDLACCCKKN